jgi:ribonuclease HI
MTSDNELSIYTDGSSLEGPRVGGIGVRYVWIDESGEEQTIDLDLPGYKQANSQQMELAACIIALAEALKMDWPGSISKIVIYTDSSYVSDHYMNAIFDWPKTKWKGERGRPILNVDQWKQLVRLMKKAHMRVDIKWVKGHHKNVHNRAVDKLARRSAKNAVLPPITHVNVRRKLSSEVITRGSVRIHGQRLSIRIFRSEHLKAHELWKYTYEVVSRNSPYRGRVDEIFSESLLKEGHCYYVVLNSEQSAPLVKSVIKELDCPKRLRTQKAS